MKTVIMLQKSVNFTVDMSRIINPDKYHFLLIINHQSYQRLCERGQEKLIEQVLITNDFSFEHLVRHIKSSVKVGEIARIITNSEYCVAVCGQLRSHFDVNGCPADIAVAMTDKVIMKNKLANAKVRLPQYLSLEEFDGGDKRQLLNSITASLKLPIIAKPRNDAACAGFVKITSEQQLQNWLDETDQLSDFEMEEFIEGRLFHVDVLRNANGVIFERVCEYTYPVAEFLNGKNLGSIVYPQDHPTSQHLRQVNADICEELDYHFAGATHCELFLTPDNEVVFLEIGARPGGAYLPKLYDAHVGVSWYALHLQLQIDESYDPEFIVRQYPVVIWFPKIDGKIIGLTKPVGLHNQYECSFKVSPGHGSKSDHLSDIAAELRLSGSDFKTVYLDFERLKTFSAIIS